LAARHYAPMRVNHNEHGNRGSNLEYDNPSSQFGQFDDEQVSAVARSLEFDIERALRPAAE
jgi:hypothetical protein